MLFEFVAYGVSFSRTLLFWDDDGWSTLAKHISPGPDAVKLHLVSVKITFGWRRVKEKVEIEIRRDC